jgi:hypothetical protein
MFFSSAERPVAFDFHDVRDELIYHEADFGVGGRDVFRCGPKGDLKFRGETSYFLIVPNVCVVSSEALDMNGQHVAASLTASISSGLGTPPN